MRIYILVILIFFSIPVFPQRKSVKTYYPNGKIESTGSMYSYSKFDKRIPNKYHYFKNLEKKDGEWKYYNESGILIRIENYRASLNIDTLNNLRQKLNDIPNGKWVYFNDEGIKYREEIYKNGILIQYVKEIYRDNSLIGNIIFNDGVLDTTILEPMTLSNNLIINPEFSFFYYKPVKITSKGASQIEEYTPFWRAPGFYTPDYVSNLRCIDGFSRYYLFTFQPPEKFNYAGIALYKNSDIYSEYIQGKSIKPLEKGHTYCIKISIALTSYSGYSVDHIGFLLSREQVRIDSHNESTFLPQIKLPLGSVDNDKFVTLCDCFTAAGGEKYISVGRFSSPEKLIIKKRAFISSSQFGADKSAYYLIDNIYLHEIQDTSDCSCDNHKLKSTIRLPQPDISQITEKQFEVLKSGGTLILKNLNFEFDSYLLQSDADSILQVLLTFLYHNSRENILISGHTDEIGSENYNLELSRNRAKSVYNWLIFHGIDSTRLHYIGFGKKYPIYPNVEDKDRALNRRVEIKLVK